MSRPPAAPTPDVDARPTPHRRLWSWRPWLLVLVVLLFISGALAGTYAWTQSQYFVGHADDDVAIYRGVNTEFGPLKFFKVYELSDLRLADLYPSVRSQVLDGITAGSRSEAKGIIVNLRSQQLPLCRTATPTPTPTPTPTSKAPTSKAPTSKVPTSKAPTSKVPTSTGRAPVATSPVRTSPAPVITTPSLATPTPGQGCRR